LFIAQPLIRFHGASEGGFVARCKQMAVEDGMETFSAPAAYSEGIACEVSWSI